jgi:hypothetical protein
MMTFDFNFYFKLSLNYFFVSWFRHFGFTPALTLL